MSNNTLEPKEITQSISKLISISEDIRGHLLEKAKDALDVGETNWLMHLSKEACEIEDCISKIKTVRERLLESVTSTLGFEDGYSDGFNHGTDDAIGTLVDSLKKSTIGVSNKRTRRIRTSISQGEINQNLLTLTQARKRGLIRLGEQFRIILPNGQDFETELVQPGNKLRERGRIREFYEEQNLKPDDYVVLEEVSAGTWTLTKENSPEMNTTD